MRVSQVYKESKDSVPYSNLHRVSVKLMLILVNAIRFILVKKEVKASSYIAQYPVVRIAQSALHFTSLTDLFTQTSSRLLWEASSHMLQLMREGYSYTYPPLSIARYSFIQLSELEQCRVKKTCPRFLTTQPGFEPGFS